MKKKLLVTGGAGFIGSNFVHYMVKRHPEYSINVYDKLTYAGNRKNLPDCFFNASDNRYVLTEACVMDRKRVAEAIIESDLILHFAGESHVTNSLAQADEFVNTNILGTVVVCEEILKYPVEKFILISSSEVYGTAIDKPMGEDHPLNPASPYAGSKAGQDRMAYSYFCSFGLPVIILRPFNQYGPRQHTEKVIPKFITRLLQKKKIYTENRGLQTRDWLFVEDLCRAIDIVIHTEDKNLIGEIINIGSGKETPIKTVATRIAELLDLDPEKYVLEGKNRKGQVMSHIASQKKAKELLCWEPSVCMEDGLRRTIEWYKRNQSWWRQLKFPVLKIAELGD
ncbi:MAG: GDP-mannose 4,6-dehydratase [Deltaproteobacteria bacterium]|nr:GDP-mannose 4,6-dehydratase [Deltaproteobacteria bacterium]MBW1993518.1 GDP-mannose 4,6-dehydratase [Deltaproteobacteria bacterium]MBW2151941.1 GDP-mannose 4,6-dehydratase [Deltaproteobacteria bacterium]